MGIPVIVAGMHRSGTSLLANLMQGAGLFVGERLQPASDTNAKGHFEDLDFQELHDEVLASHGSGLLYSARASDQFTLDERQVARAGELVGLRSDVAVWGWKDPRTTLFLDFWADLVPEAKFVFIFRAPELVVNSLRGRGDPPLLVPYPWAWFLDRLRMRRFRYGAAIRMWKNYNERTLRFARANRDRCQVLEVQQLEQQFPVALRRMRDDWGLPLNEVRVGDILDPALLTVDVSAGLKRFCRAYPGASRIYQALRGECGP